MALSDSKEFHTKTRGSRRVLILGGGFAGVRAARTLQRELARVPDIEVVLISRENYVLFTPMLHEIAAGDLEPADIVNPLRRMLQRVRLVQGDVRSVNLDRRIVRYAVGAGGQMREITYDYLLLALGSETNFFGMTDVEANATTMKSLADAALLRNQMVALLEEAAEEEDEARRRRLLTFVVAGGGFAGVETVGAMNDFLRDAVRYYPRLDESMLRLVLVHPGAVVLPELGERLGTYAQTKLMERGVEVLLNTRVTGCDGYSVQLTSNETIDTLSLIWTAGTRPATVLDPLPTDRLQGRLKVNEFLEVSGHEGVVWAVGDCAAVPNGSGGVHPPTAQHGIREAHAAAGNIRAAVEGRAPVPFRFSTLGQLASIGHRTGVAQIFGIRFSGFVAWWLWRSVYLLKLPGAAKKVRVMAKWTFELVFPREIEQLITIRDIERIGKLSSKWRVAQESAACLDTPAEKISTVNE